MKRLFFVATILVLVMLLLVTGCQKTTSSTSTSSSQPPKTTASSVSPGAPVATTPTTGTPSSSVPVQTSEPLKTQPTATKANWWDKDGTPQYGGTLNLPSFRTGNLEGNFDVWNMMDFSAGYFDELFDYDWTLDRNVFGFQVGWVPDEYIKDALAESWEWKDAQTLVVHLKKGIKWQNKPPVNGREFTAQDVQYHYDRLLGTGSGFTEPSPSYLNALSLVKNVVANDKYTVTINFKNPTALLNAWQIYDPVGQHFADPPEWVAQGDLNNWKNAVGTGPFTVADFVSGSSMTLKKNPDYWGYDERHPQNKLPYVDEVKILVIPDVATTVAALRTAKIDIMMEMNKIQMENLDKTNPEILRKPVPAWSEALSFRVDSGPFSDIRVRKALTLAIDRQAISKALWGTDGKPCGAIPPIYSGYTLLYDDWPEDLRSEYSYNPAKAKQLMVEAGYPNGFKTNVVAASNNDMELLQLCKAYFKEISVDMEIRVMDPQSANQFVRSRKHDAMTVAMGGVGTPPLMSFENARAVNNNAVCHNDQTYEEFVDRFRNSQTPDEAKKLAVEGVLYLLRQHWNTGPMPKTVYNVWQPYIKGYNGEGGPSFYGMRGWYYARFWIDKSLKK